MNQPTHAWLAVEAFSKVESCARTPEGRRLRLGGLVKLLDQHLGDVVVASWLPDSLIKDMTYGHVFKNSIYPGDQTKRFTLTKPELEKHLAPSAFSRAQYLNLPDAWWSTPYRVKDGGGHLPARVNALCQSARDMLKMGDGDTYEVTGARRSPGATQIADSLLYSPRDIAMALWMASHYIADAHMPFHCDNRALASTASQKTHGAVEDLWGKHVPALFHAKKLLRRPPKEILDAPFPDGSRLEDIDFGSSIEPLENSGDPWKEAVFICRASFATSFALVPPEVAQVDDRDTLVSLEDILEDGGFCGEQRFWDISRAIMRDAVASIAMFWTDVWVDFVKPTET